MKKIINNYINLSELSRKTKIPHSTLSRYRDDPARIKYEHLIVLVRVLELNPMDLFR